MRKCGCEIHLKMTELVAGLHKWRMAAQKELIQLDKNHVPAAEDYFETTKSLSNFCNHVCPCDRASCGNRRLDCVRGSCDVCRNVRSQLTISPGEEQLHSTLPVKYKWLRAVKIGNRNDTEWAWMEKSYTEFEELLVGYYQDTYRLHNWIYK